MLAIVVAGTSGFSDTLRSVRVHVHTPYDLYVVCIGSAHRKMTHHVDEGMTFESACRSLLASVNRSRHSAFWFLPAGLVFESDILSSVLSDIDASMVPLYPEGYTRAPLLPTHLLYDSKGEPTRFLFPKIDVEWPPPGAHIVDDYEFFQHSRGLNRCKICGVIRVNRGSMLDDHLYLSHGIEGSRKE